MLLAISIISGIFFLFYFILFIDGRKCDDTNIFVYATILVISTWMQNVTTAITFLCICIVMIIIAVIAYVKQR